MCGIVGYYGNRDPKKVLIDSLKKLEYRGYDSAGISILDHGHFRRVRAQGKLSFLEEKLKNENFDGSIGIGHTRWATHGAPTEKNAHPHRANEISLVHNGIIENYMEIKEQLLHQGIQLYSDTDSELVAHLIEIELAKNPNFLSAVANVLPQLRGAYSILVVWDQEPNMMIAFKNGPPLLLGCGNNEIIIASDLQAIVPYTKKIIYLEDDEIIVTHKDQFKIHQKSTSDSHELGPLISKKIHEIDWTSEKIEKHGYPHFMLKEIHEQPNAVASAIKPHINLETNEVLLNGIEKKFFQNIQRVIIVGCGTSFYAAMVGKYLIEPLSKTQVEIDIASEFRYRMPILNPSTLLIVISQSGETADTLAVLRQAKQFNTPVLSICNVKNSTIDREADLHLYMNAGPEIGVASTKAFCSTLAILNLFAITIAKEKKQIDRNSEKEILSALISIPSLADQVLSYNHFFSLAAQTLKSQKGFLYMGRGLSYPIALEGALKLKELAYMHAEGYAAGEMKHGPLALIDDQMMVVMILPSDSLYEKTLSNLEEVRARGAKIISIGTGENEVLKKLSHHYISIPKVHWSVTPLLTVIPLQLLAYYVAQALGHDVDQPRNLAKSVTVE